MSRKYYVETLPSGKQQFISLKRSRSHHHHHHHDHHDHAHITREEWESMLERERHLRETNDALVRDNHVLKASLQSAEAEVHRLSSWIGPVQTQNNELMAENKALRRSIDNMSDHNAQHHREVEKLRHKIHKLERENGELLSRIRDLTRRCEDIASDKIADLTAKIEAWKLKYDATYDRYVRMRKDYEDQSFVVQEQSERLTVFERILRRHHLLC